MKVFDFMQTRGYIASVVDNRTGPVGLITVSLKEGYFFKAAPDADVQSFETLRLACAGCSKNNVFNPEEDAKKAASKAGKAKAKADAKAAKVMKVPKASKAPKVAKVPTAAKVAKTPKALSMTPDAVAKREKRAAQKVAAAAIVAEALVA